MNGESGASEEYLSEIPKGGLDGADTLEGELSKELAVLHRVIRHNFRNRLNVILGQAELARASTDDAELEAYLDSVLTEVKDLVQTVDQVGLIDRLASSSSKPKPVDIAPTLRDIVTEYDEQSAATIEWTIPDSVWVWMNPTYPKAFRELIDNAVSHNDSEDPHVAVRVTEGNMTGVVIEDNGPGMPSGTKEALESTSVDPTSHLTTLGLWMAYWVVTRSDGSLSIEDNDPTGCRITIELLPTTQPET